MENTEQVNSSLYKGKYVELCIAKGPGYNYEFVHETRCDGHIVAILPVHVERGILLRQEFTPCWGGDLNISSITGGWEKAKHRTPLDTAIEELREEAGIIVREESSIRSLGTCRGTKSSDNLYHLFLVDLSDDEYDEVAIDGDGSALERKAHNEWMATGFDVDEESDSFILDSPWIMNGRDPLLYVMYTRWVMGMSQRISRGHYKDMLI